jgi:hypothetical protein
VDIRQYGDASDCDPAADTIERDRLDHQVAPDPAHPL